MPNIENHMVTDQDEFNTKGLGYIDQSSVHCDEVEDETINWTSWETRFVNDGIVKRDWSFWRNYIELWKRYSWAKNKDLGSTSRVLQCDTAVPSGVDRWTALNSWEKRKKYHKIN